MSAAGSDSLFPARGAVSVRSLLEQPAVRALGELIAGADGVDRVIEHPRIQKSGLVLVGHMVGLVPTRVQIVGETELSFVEAMGDDERRGRLEALFAQRLSLVVVTRGAAPPAAMVEAAGQTSTPLLCAEPRSSQAIHVVHRALDRLLAPADAVHGVLVDVHGIGMLIRGPSGIGKSECALFLVERGHRLVADDRVELTRRPSGRVVGRPAPLLRHHLEVRGIGIVNVRDLFGATAVRDDATVDLIVELCPFRAEDEYERLGLDEPLDEVVGVGIPLLRIPVRPGRDMAVILEVAARHQLLKRAGHHPAREFARTVAAGTGGAPPDGPEGPG